MYDEKSIRVDLIRMMWHAASTAHIEKNPSKESCQSMIDRMVEIFLTANDGLVEAIHDDFSRAKSRDVNGKKKTWISRLRKAVHAYCDALYYELVLVDAYVSGPSDELACEKVIQNPDCLRRAARRATILVKERKRSFQGFVFFETVARLFSASNSTKKPFDDDEDIA